MFKAFIYKSGKLIPAFNSREYENLIQVKQAAQWFFEARRNDQAIQFIVVDKNDRIVEIITSDPK